MLNEITYYLVLGKPLIMYLGIITLLCFVFTASEQIPSVWTTVRRFEPKKYEYYEKLIGKEIEIIIGDFS